MTHYILLISILLSVMATVYCSADAVVTKIDYKGWTDCYQLSNSLVKVVIVPQIGGRIMEYSIDGHNVIWQNKDELGHVTGEKPKAWQNYGGHKIWNAPQAKWNTADLDNLYDSQPAKAEIIPGCAGVRITTTPIKPLGFQFIQEVYLHSDTSRVSVVQRMKNVSGRDIEWSVWGVTQLGSPCWIVFPINKQSKFPQGWNLIYPDKTHSGQVQRVGQLGVVKYKGAVENWATDAGAGWIAYLKDRTAFVKRWSVRQTGVTYPNGGCDAAFFTQGSETKPIVNDPNGYVELEVLGPIIKLKPGEETLITEDWSLTQLNQDAKDVSDVMSRLKLLEKRGLLPPTQQSD